MQVLSLFDGISCGKVALDRLGIKVEKYYASEIDKYALQISKKNNPDIIQLGDIRKLAPIECERLQTLPDNYTQGVSDSQRCKMLGNGWTVEVIKSLIGKDILKKKVINQIQLNLF